MATRPDKYLKYDDQNYVGYFQQLTTIVRSNTHADDLLDDLLTNPLADLRSTLEEDPLTALLMAHRAIDPTCAKLPTAAELALDPIKHIKLYLKANRLIAISLADDHDETYNTGGAAVNAWTEKHQQDIKDYVSAEKFIWKTITVTLHSPSPLCS